MNREVPLTSVLRHRVGAVPELPDRILDALARLLRNAGVLLLVDHQRHRGSGHTGCFGDFAEGHRLGTALPHRNVGRGRVAWVFLLRNHLPSIRSISIRHGRHPFVAPLSRPWIMALFRTRKTSSSGVMVTQTAANVAVQSIEPMAPI